MEITPQTVVNNLLTEYPQLEAYLMQLHPKYKKLKNPILRRTVARIATLSQVAKIGGFNPLELTNLLRKEVGQPLLNEEGTVVEEEETERPNWLEGKEAAIVLDGDALLEAQKNPLAEVRKALKKLEAGQVLRLDTDFLPEPLIDTFKKDGLQVWSEKIDEDRYRTWLLAS
ncbi:DUF1858 domain-containing protein [Nitratifractor sp.]